MADTVHNLDQPIGALIDIAVKEFGEVKFETVSFGDISLEILQIRDMSKYLDKLIDKTRGGKTITLPLWAKVWPSCLVLGYTLSRFPFADDATFLEVGAGCAVNGLLLAALGYEVVITDLEPYALLFSKINALKNGLEDRVALQSVDFTSDSMGRKFDYIIGCEVLYAEATYEPLADFINDHLSTAPHAEVLLALDRKRQGRRFFKKAEADFAMMKSDGRYKDKETGEEDVINLYRMKRKAQ